MTVADFLTSKKDLMSTEHVVDENGTTSSVDAKASAGEEIDDE